MNKKRIRKLSLSRETLRVVTGALTSTKGCSGTCFTCVTFCGTCPVVTRDWPSCAVTQCTECFTDLCDKA